MGVKPKVIDITDMLTEEGKKLPVGKVLIFRTEGSETHLKIIKKKKGKVYAEEAFLYKPDEVRVVDVE